VPSASEPVFSPITCQGFKLRKALGIFVAEMFMLASIPEVEATRDFFIQDPLTCARALIGAHLHWDGCTARIVETEAYTTVDDPAFHLWNRPSVRAYLASHEAGDAYVYLNYGIRWLFNIFVKGREVSGFVLLRAIEPINGIVEMRSRRPGVADRMLGAGPGRLTRALGIDGRDHGCRFLETEGRGITLHEPLEPAVGVRIGISKAVDFPWRFGDRASLSLSRRF